jgi:hypothetical protein
MGHPTQQNWVYLAATKSTEIHNPPHGTNPGPNNTNDTDAYFCGYSYRIDVKELVSF